MEKQTGHKLSDTHNILGIEKSDQQEMIQLGEIIKVACPGIIK